MVHAKSASHRLHYHKISQSQAREALRSASPVGKKALFEEEEIVTSPGEGGGEGVCAMALKAFGLAMPPQLATCEEKECEGMLQVLEESGVRGSAVKKRG